MRYGVNSHIAPDPVLESLLSIGIQWHRVDFNWDQIEPQDHQHNWYEVDRAVGTINRSGGSVLGVIAYAPQWASGSSSQAAPPRDPQRFADFCREVATRYPPGQIVALSVWNEPNLRQFWAGSRDDYLRMYPIALRAIRDAVPILLTVGPDLSSSGNPLQDWLPAILEVAGSQIDVISHHQYDGGDTVAGRVAEIDKFQAFTRGKQLWITETGWDRVSEEQQADNLRGIMQAMQERPWWAKTFWYDSHGPKWGLVEDDLSPQHGQPKAAYYAYRDVIAKEANA